MEAGRSDLWHVGSSCSVLPRPNTGLNELL
ncbi:hypothetical protein XFF6991_150521 [Xanthomonas phaseoli pv. phaseoli]|uniref:Uncharacterized protein n=1 Tax=Xanthomonas campestris pv. phaseoli TaxID=317013 RepID=A0A7Z7IWA5_XANCH|nr:hypothetical protein XFF6991_150521 [Xanthomonas phaseoli pv. phaseoli]